ncbi:alpha-mannosidase [Bacteroidia bacterium]|nr:alpha-mannosidase [Bacteroidia bacterium]
MKKKMLGILLCACMTVNLLQGQPQNKAYMVSNAHFDTQWLWTVQTSIDEYLYRTLTQNFWLIDHYPDYVFNFEGAVKYAWAKEYYPAEFQRLKEYVKAGRWNIAGSSWDANDPNMPSPESFFRNILLGQEFYKREFDVKANDIFLPDCFGFGYTLPTIAAHAGLIGFSTQKLQWRKYPFYGTEKIPFLIGLWEGLDGSRIMAVPHAQSYVTRFDNEDLSRDEKIRQIAEKDPNHVVYHYYGVGDRGGSPTVPSVASIERGIHGDGPLKIISARSGQLFDDFYPFDKHPELPVFKGELLMDVHATGCYTSQAAMKRFNRRNEQLADAAERAATLAECLGGLTYPAGELRTSWQRFLWHQFHDDMTGTSIPAVYTFSWNDELISQTQFAGIINTAVGAVSRALNTQTDGTPLVVYNPVARERKDIVTATVPVNIGKQLFSIVGPKGEKTAAQILSQENGQATIAFPANIASVGFSVYDVKTGNSQPKTPLKVSERSIENSIYKLTLDKNGDIASIIDKRYDRELVQAGHPFRLALFTKNESLNWPAWEIWKETIDQTPVSIDQNVKISIVESGPVRAALKVERNYGKSTFVQTIYLTNGGDDARIDITAHIDWNETNSLLKAEFPMNVANEKAVYDLGLGYIERGNNTQTAYEVFAQQWADITQPDDSYGIAILNDCKYGWDKPNDNTLRLTLLHTPKVGDDPNMTHQDHLDWGHHTIRYAIVGHTSTAVEAGIAGQAEAFNQPLAAFVAPKHKGNLGRNFSWIATNSPQLAVKALKKSENGESYVIRVNEISGKDLASGRIHFAFPITSAQELNGIEESIGNVRFEGNDLIVDAKAFQPRTFGVTFQSSNYLQQPVNQFVDLKYNANALTIDAFNLSGDFDKDGNSFAAELMPETVVSEGIAFQMNNRFEENNYVRCDGQTITLPGHSAGTLYLLMTSSEGDRTATVEIDGQATKIDVPYYSGFYGQWGWTGQSEASLRKASIAYLGTHRHSEKKGNESYVYTYLYKFGIPVTATARTLVLPKDKNVALFAVTLSDNPNQVQPANELRALP